MPKLKKKEDRLILLNRMLGSGWITHKDIEYTIEETLLEKVNIKTIQNDFNEIRQKAYNDGQEDPIERRKAGGVMQFRYRDKHFSYIEPLINDSHLVHLKEAIHALKKYDGLELAENLQSVTHYLYRKYYDEEFEAADYFQPQRQQGYIGSQYMLDLSLIHI